MKTLEDIYRPVHMDMMDIGIRRVPDGLVEEYNLNMDPEYQRGHVWTQSQRAKYMGFILQGGKTLPVVINVPGGWGSDYCEIVDGKQRITSICKWMRGHFLAELYDGSKVDVDQLKSHKPSWRKLGTGLTLRIGFVHLDEEGVLDYYLRLNNGGTVHGEDEINRVRDLLREKRSK